jgi:hypothetical protein
VIIEPPWEPIMVSMPPSAMRKICEWTRRGTGQSVGGSVNKETRTRTHREEEEELAGLDGALELIDKVIVPEDGLLGGNAVLGHLARLCLVPKLLLVALNEVLDAALGERNFGDCSPTSRWLAADVPQTEKLSHSLRTLAGIKDDRALRGDEDQALAHPPEANRHEHWQARRDTQVSEASLLWGIRKWGDTL